MTTGPVNYIERIWDWYGKQGYPPYRWAQNDTAPLTPLAKPLSECVIGIVSTSGVYHPRTQEPFQPVRDDLTFREVPRSLPQAELAISHDGYDHSDAERDINCIIPFDIMDRLEREGVVRRFASPAFTFMGRVFRRTYLQEEMAPWLEGRFRELGVDAVLLIPI